MKKFLKIMTAAAGLLIGQDAFAQRRDLFNNIYFFTEVGSTDENILSIQGGVMLLYKGNYYKIKATTLDIPYEKAYRLEADPVPGIADVSFMVGKSYNLFKQQQLEFGGGLSVIEEVTQIPFEETAEWFFGKRYQRRHTAGFATELKYNVYITRNLAANLTGYANLNSIKSYKGLALGLRLGLF